MSKGYKGHAQVKTMNEGYLQNGIQHNHGKMRNTLYKIRNSLVLTYIDLLKTGSLDNATREFSLA